MLKFVRIRDKTQNDEIVARMPLFVWNLTGRLCHNKGPLGLLGGSIIASYRQDYGSGRSWRASFIDGVKVWWHCRGAWRS